MNTIKNSKLPPTTTLISWLLVIAWMIIIFLFSAQSGEDSGELSGGLLEKIAVLLTWLHLDTFLSKLPFNFHFLIRKAAHFTEYMLLGILVANAFKNSSRKILRPIPSQAICTLYAISDEIHQLFIPGRAGQLKDVLIDSAGAAAGILLFSYFIIYLQKKKKYTYVTK